MVLVVAFFTFQIVEDEGFSQQLISSDGVYVNLYRLRQGNLTLGGFTSENDLRVLVRKDNTQTWHKVNLNKGYFEETIFLQEIGTFDVFVMIHVRENRYRYGPHFRVNNTFQRPSTYTQNASNYHSPPSQVETKTGGNNFSSSSLALEITRNLRGDYEKAKAIYKWVSDNIAYDRQKYIRFLNGNYGGEHGAKFAWETRRGVCYDYALLVSEMCKAVGIEARMVTGYYNYKNGHREYHAWNEMYIPELGKWISSDSTFASVHVREYFDSTFLGRNYERE